MRHWYGYHSEKTMGHSYASVGASRIYLSKAPKTLKVGDFIWVVAGDLLTPTRFTLVDRFEFEDAEYPPFKPEYSRFAVSVSGSRSLLKSTSPLNKTESWFADLHARFITKQKFFSRLDDEPDIVAGLVATAGLMTTVAKLFV